MWDPRCMMKRKSKESIVDKYLISHRRAEISHIEEALKLRVEHRTTITKEVCKEFNVNEKTAFAFTPTSMTLGDRRDVVPSLGCSL